MHLDIKCAFQNGKLYDVNMLLNLVSWVTTVGECGS